MERGVHHIEIPKSSRDVRNIAFLGGDDEKVIVISGGKRFSASLRYSHECLLIL
jgi:hypothetical protein